MSSVTKNAMTHPHLEGLNVDADRINAFAAIEGCVQWMLHRFGPDSIEAQHARLIHTSASRLSALAALPGGGVDDLVECHRHSCKRKAALRQPRLIGWRSADYTMETADQKVASNWAGNIEVLPIFEGDPNTKLPTPPPHEADRNG